MNGSRISIYGDKRQTNYPPPKKIEQEWQELDYFQTFKMETVPLDLVFAGFRVGNVGALVAPGGVGKSFFALQLATQVAGGKDFLGFGELKKGKVVYLSAEDDFVLIQHRIKAINEGVKDEQVREISENVKIIPRCGYQNNIMDDSWFEMLLSKCKGARVLIIDTLRRIHFLDENSSSDMSHVLSRMEELAHRAGCAVLFLHHTNKGASANGSGDSQGASRGSSVLVDNIRFQANLIAMNEQEESKYDIQQGLKKNFVRFVVSKQNSGASQEDVWLRRVAGGRLEKADMVLRREDQKINNQVFDLGHSQKSYRGRV